MKKALSLVALVLASCSLVQTSHRDGEKFFVTEVKPVLQQHCLRCHNGSLPPPAPNFTSKANAFKTPSLIVPRHPDQSLLVAAVQRGGTHPKMMPRTDISLTDDQIGMLREWIEEGAHWPEGESGALRPLRSGENP